MANKQVKKFQKNIISTLKANKSALSIQELKKELNISKKNTYQFEQMLTSLIKSGQVKNDPVKNQYFIPSKSMIITGELRITRGGFGFVRDMDNGIDIFINRDHLNTAFDRDIVEVKLYAKPRGKNQEGFVTQIIERKRKQFVGTFHRTKYYGFMVCEFDGDVQDLEVEADFKPQHEVCGFSYAKWFEDKAKRDKTMEFTIKTIKKIQDTR